MTVEQRARINTQCRNLGFDRTTRSEDGVCPRCSQCEVLVIQGVPCHETGCPNARKSRESEEEFD
jgi:hypothetical protein